MLFTTKWPQSTNFSIRYLKKKKLFLYTHKNALLNEKKDINEKYLIRHKKRKTLN